MELVTPETCFLPLFEKTQARQGYCYEWDKWKSPLDVKMYSNQYKKILMSFT